MATPEQIASILSQLVALHPADCFKPIDAANAGLGAVLRLLYLADQPVTAGDHQRETPRQHRPGWRYC